MKILILNWRDLKHPKSGGAEVITEGLARRLVKSGHEVTLFCASFLNSAPEEKIEGVKVIRQGSELTCRWHAYKYYKKHENEFDLVVDEVNTIPFFTPLYVPYEKRLGFFHQLCRNVWWYEASFPKNLIGWMIEPIYLLLYRNTKCIAMSESTKADLKRFGVKAEIFVLPEAIEVQKPKFHPKEQELTLIFVGRLNRSKRPHHALKAYREILKQVPNAKLWIVGEGPMKPKLEKMIKRWELQNKAILWGKVESIKKFDLMQRAHFLVVPSVREGWGLVVSEAALLGTPAVVYDVPGLRDSTDYGKIGFVCHNSPKSIADKILEVWQTHFYENCVRAARKFSQKLTWENCFQSFKKNLIS